MSGGVCPACVGGDHSWHDRYTVSGDLAECARQGIPGDINTPCDCPWRGVDGPFRVQRQRTRGWRMPEGAVYVGRPTAWGNPWRVGDCVLLEWPLGAPSATVREMVISPELAVALYRIAFTPDADEIRAELSGRDLACWCPLDQPCHADVLLEIANEPARRT